MVLRHEAHHRRAYTQVEEAVVSGDGKDQHPDSECSVSEAVNDEGGKKDADQNIDAQRKPARGDVAENLAFFNLQHNQVKPGSNEIRWWAISAAQYSARPSCIIRSTWAGLDGIFVLRGWVRS